MRAAPIPARKPRENRTRWVVLGMLSAAPMTGYGLRKAIEGSVGHFWQESFGQLYPTLRKLAAEGLVEGKATRGGPGRGAAVYHVTERGRAALAGWLALPPVLEPARNEVLLKVFFAGAVPPDVTARNLDAVAAALRAEQAALEAIGARIPCQPSHPDAPYWRLTLEYGLEFMRTTLAWLDRATATVRSAGAGRATRAAAAPHRAARRGGPRTQRGNR
jgi:DNA-binding PadR family transcriptional regulator